MIFGLPGDEKTNGCTDCRTVSTVGWGSWQPAKVEDCAEHKRPVELTGTVTVHNGTGSNRTMESMEDLRD